MEFFVDPGEEAGGGVGEGVGEGLRFCGLEGAVAGAFLEHPFITFCGVVVVFVMGGGEEFVLEVEERVGKRGGGVAADHVDVGGHDVGGVAEGHDARDHAAPVAALGHVFRIPEAEHEFVACFGVLGEGETAFVDGGGETEVGEGGGDDVEGGGCGGGEEGEDLGDFEEGSGPWMVERLDG